MKRHVWAVEQMFGLRWRVVHPRMLYKSAKALVADEKAFRLNSKLRIVKYVPEGSHET
jgi:hypothetical protein